MVAPITGTQAKGLDPTALTKANTVGNTNFAGKSGTSIQAEELALIMLNGGFFNIEEIATFVGIAERETNYTPYRYNDSEAIGMWQMIIKSGNWISAALPIVAGSSTAVSGKTILGWKLRNKKSTKQPSSDEMKKDGWTGQSVDEVFWIPFNQVSILAWQTLTYPGQENHRNGKRNSAQSIVLWSNWGDGPWGRNHGGADDPTNMPYGFLTGVKPSTVKRVYESLGGTWIVYQAWALKALVDGYDKYPSPRSNADVIKLKDSNGKYKAATYRNYWDVYVWVNFEKYKDTYFKDNIISTEAAGGIKMRYSSRYGEEFCYPLGKTNERTLYASEATVPGWVDPAPAAAVITSNRNRTDASGRSGQ